MKEYLTYDDVNILPKYSEIETRKNVDISSNLFKKYKLNLPIVSSPMDTVTGMEMVRAMENRGGIGCLHRFDSTEFQIAELDYSSTVDIIVSIGVTNNYFDRLFEFYDEGVRLFCLDIAHGHHILLRNAAEKIKNKFPDVYLIGGSIATPEAGRDQINWGIDCLRVGIGGSGVCTTRIMTGVGVPMISCIQNIYNEIQDTNIPIMADGGIKTPGDVCKALAAGASTVMLGTMLAGTDESPGEVIIRRLPCLIKVVRLNAVATGF